MSVEDTLHDVAAARAEFTFNKYFNKKIMGTQVRNLKICNTSVLLSSIHQQQKFAAPNS